VALLLIKTLVENLHLYARYGSNHLIGLFRRANGRWPQDHLGALHRRGRVSPSSTGYATAP